MTSHADPTGRADYLVAQVYMFDLVVRALSLVLREQIKRVIVALLSHKTNFMSYFDHSGSHIKTTLERYQQKKTRKRGKQKFRLFEIKEQRRSFK